MRALRRVRRLVIPVAAVLFGVVAWLVAPAGFARGLVAGGFGMLLVLFGGAMVFARKMIKRLDVNLQPPSLPTGSWDYDLEAQDLEGERVSFSRFEGRVLLLNHWATWCAPCVAEMPSLRSLLEATREAGVEMACVTKEERDVVIPFVAKRGLDVPVYLVSGDLPEIFSTRSIPATFVIDKRGTMVMRHSGAAKWDDESIVGFLRGLAAAP